MTESERGRDLKSPRRPSATSGPPPDRRCAGTGTNSCPPAARESVVESLSESQGLPLPVSRLATTPQNKWKGLGSWIRGRSPPFQTSDPPNTPPHCHYSRRRLFTAPRRCEGLCCPDRYPDPAQDPRSGSSFPSGPPWTYRRLPSNSGPTGLSYRPGTVSTSRSRHLDVRETRPRRRSARERETLPGRVPTCDKKENTLTWVLGDLFPRGLAGLTPKHETKVRRAVGVVPTSVVRTPCVPPVAPEDPSGGGGRGGGRRSSGPSDPRTPPSSTVAPLLWVVVGACLPVLHGPPGVPHVLPETQVGTTGSLVRPRSPTLLRARTGSPPECTLGVPLSVVGLFHSEGTAGPGTSPLATKRVRSWRKRRPLTQKKD